MLSYDLSKVPSGLNNDRQDATIKFQNKEYRTDLSRHAAEVLANK